MADKYIEQAPGGELTSPAGTEKFNVTNEVTDYWMTLNGFVSFVAASVYPSFRNLIINGDMQIAQRGTSFAGITAGAFFLDRMRFEPSNLGTWTISQDTDVPSGSGFRRSFKALVTTADAAPAAADLCTFQYRFEGYHLQHLRKGTSSAKSGTVSFWIKASTTGTYICELFDNDNTRQISKSFTVNAANTWEYKTITFAGDTTGPFDNDANLSMYFIIWAAAGSNYTSGALNTSWAAVTNANRAVGQVNLAGSVNNYMNITGLQLEIGTAATSFEFLPWDIQMQRCTRYYQKSFAYETVPAQNAGTTGSETANITGASHVVRTMIRFAAPMRAAPTITTYNPSAANAQIRDVTAGLDFSATSSTFISTKTALLFGTANAGSAAGNGAVVNWSADAEL